MAAARLAVRRLALVARVPRDQRLIPGLAHDLGEMLPRLVTPRLAHALDRVLPDDDTVTLIRRVEVDLAISAGWDAERIAAAIAGAIVAAIRRALHNAAAAHVLPDRPTHLAAVLTDIAAGSGRRWHHGAYGKLSDRPRAEALIAVLDEAGADGPATLALVDPQVAARIVRALPDTAVARLAQRWDVLSDKPPSVSTPTVLTTMAVRAAAGLPPDLAADPHRAALLLLARVVAELPATAAETRAEAVRAMLARVATDRSPRIVMASQSENRPAGPDASPNAARADDASVRPVVPDAAPFATMSQNAALFLLWRSAIESGVLATATRVGAGGAMALARALAGPDRDPVTDPAVAWLLRDEPADGHELPPLRLAAIRPEPTPIPQAVLQSIDGALGCYVLVDASNGGWRGVWRQAPDPALLRDCELIEPAAATSLLPSRVAADLAGLALVGGDPETVLAWAWLAERVMRDFARRIPGFAHASVAWLRANLLPLSAFVTRCDEAGMECLEVHFNPPPVGMLLRIAGLHATDYRPPGRPARVVRLRMARG
jgi:hypothetical protein